MSKLRQMIKRIIKEETSKFERIPFERVVDSRPINPHYSNKRYKIVRTAYDDEGTNVLALLDLVNKKVISYSITGIAERQKFEDLMDDFNNMDLYPGSMGDESSAPR